MDHGVHGSILHVMNDATIYQTANTAAHQSSFLIWKSTWLDDGTNTVTSVCDANLAVNTTVALILSYNVRPDVAEHPLSVGANWPISAHIRMQTFT